MPDQNPRSSNLGLNDLLSMATRGPLLSYLKSLMLQSIGAVHLWLLILSHLISNRTKLSKALIIDPTEVVLKSPADLKIKHGTTLRLGAVCLQPSPLLSSHLERFYRKSHLWI